MTRAIRIGSTSTSRRTPSTPRTTETNENGDTVTVFNGATCNGTNGNGCAQSGHKIHSGPNPFDVLVDQATDTVYVANSSFNDGSVAVINGATCNAKIKSGCAQSPAQVPTGSNPQFLALDGSLHTLFAHNEADDTISEIDTRFCNGTADSGCSARPLNEQATFNPPESGGSPNGSRWIRGPARRTWPTWAGRASCRR